MNTIALIFSEMRRKEGNSMVTGIFGAGLPEKLTELPRGAVVCMVGAGGKTTLLHMLAEFYRENGFHVLAGTTTHMEKPEKLCVSPAAAIREMAGSSIAFTGLPDPENERKIISLPEEELRTAVKASDYTFLEADGARRMPVKVPYGHEPVLPPYTTHVVSVGGMHAVGKPVGLISYNREGVIRFLEEYFSVETVTGESTLLTEEMLCCIVRRAYEDKVRAAAPHAELIPVLHDLSGGGTGLWRSI